MVAVPRYFDAFDPSASKTKAVGSSIRLAQPVMNGINHLLGYTMQGPLCWTVSEEEPTANTSMERSFYCYRHPNCEALHILVKCGECTWGEDSPTIAAQAGAGGLVERRAPESGAWVELVPAWHASDSDYCEVVITGTDVGFQAVVAQELIRLDLDPSSDTCLSPYEPTYPAAGLREGRYIIDSVASGPEGMVTRTAEAWKYGCRQGPTWFSVGTSVTVDSTDWTNPFGAHNFKFRARQQKSSDDTKEHRVYAYTWGAGTVTSYEWCASHGPTLIEDGDMEDTGITAWDTTGTVTKETTDPAEGVRNIKLLDTGTVNGRARQAVLTVGEYYRVRGFVRTDDTAYVYIGGALAYTSTSSSWESFDVISQASSNDYFTLIVTAASAYAEFDDITVEHCAHSGSLSQTSGAWTGSPQSDCDFDCTADDEFEFFMRRTGGSGAVNVQRIKRYLLGAHNRNRRGLHLRHPRLNRLDERVHHHEGFMISRTVAWQPSLRGQGAFGSSDRDVNILADWNMERSDLGAWTDMNGNCSKETGDPHSGSRCLRCTDDGSNSNVYQSILEAGESYRVVGWARAEAGGEARVVLGTGNEIHNETSTDWTKFDETGVAADGKFYLSQIINDRYAEFDDISVFKI